MDLTKLDELTIKEISALYAQLAPKEQDQLMLLVAEDARQGVRRLANSWKREKAERARLMNLYAYEKAAMAEGAQYIAGVDEAGRGPLAGPVVAAAVILPYGLQLPKLNDSKKLSEKTREELYSEIREKAIAVQTAIIDAVTIDRVNIYQATMNGMYDAIFALQPVPDTVLIDAVELKHLTMPSKSIIKGDAKSASIAAASVIAKVTRDRMMTVYDAAYPRYGFAQHKGYGTAQHIEAIQKLGVTPIHRRSFEPIRSMGLH